MLVLSRRVGEQIVLPNCGVTIDVVQIGRKRVRLGINAPSGIPVHRSEIWQRISRENAAEPAEAGAGERQQPVCQAGTNGRCDWQQSSGDLDTLLARWIAERTGGRLRALCVKTVAGRLVVSGSIGSYYARQLAQAAVSEMLARLNDFSPKELEFNIDVVTTPCSDAARH